MKLEKEAIREILLCVHKRKEFLHQHYGHAVATATTIGEGVYLFSNVLGSHEIEWFVYCGLAVVWVGHTIIIGLGE